MSNTAALVDEYLTITGKIALLQERRDKIKSELELGRNHGTTKDIRVGNYMTGRHLSVNLLRRYVSQEVIDRCMTGGHRRLAYQIVDKLKPKKVKNASKSKSTKVSAAAGGATQQA